MTSADDCKRAAAQKAVELVEDGMTLGLGTGSTAAHFVDLLGEKIRTGLSVAGIPTSKDTEARALAAGIDLIEPDETTQIDLAVDGADEVDPALGLIKGGGGALLREKIIAEAAKRFVVIADASKSVSQLGAFPLPVEIIEFSWAMTVRRMREIFVDLGYGDAVIDLRASGASQRYLSDNGNFIVDCRLKRITNPHALEAALKALPGVVETGLFLDLTDHAILGGPDGVSELTKK